MLDHEPLRVFLLQFNKTFVKHGIRTRRAAEFVASYQNELPELLAIAPPEGEMATLPAAAGQSSGGASESEELNGSAEAKPAKKPPANPDEMEQTDESASEVVVEASTPEAAAWASFCQALFAAGEFRYLP